jgi:hypothetical protein
MCNKYARLGKSWLTVEPGQDETRAVTLSVKDSGPVVGRNARQRLFRPFSQRDRQEGNDLAGLGPAICQDLMTLLGRDIGCGCRTSEAGQHSNALTTFAAFWPRRGTMLVPTHAAVAQVGDDLAKVARILREVTHTDILSLRFVKFCRLGWEACCHPQLLPELPTRPPLSARLHACSRCGA